MAIENCRACGAIFQRFASPLCKTCEEKEQQVNGEIYRFIHDNPGTDMETLAIRFGMKTNEMNRLIFSGKLGTASQLVKCYCTRCKCEIPAGPQMARFCQKCQNSVERDIETTRPPEEAPKEAYYGSSRSSEPSKPQTDKPVVRNASGEIRTTGDKSKSFGFKR